MYYDIDSYKEQIQSMNLDWANTSPVKFREIVESVVPPRHEDDWADDRFKATSKVNAWGIGKIFEAQDALNPA